MNRIIACALVTTTISLSAHAIVEVKVADQFGTFRDSGPVTGTSGSRWISTQGGTGSFSSTSAIRFDVSDVVSSFDSSFGNGGWRITNMMLVLERDTASFTNTGSINVFHFSNDSLAITHGEDVGDDPPGSFGSLSTADLVYDDTIPTTKTRTSGGGSVDFGTLTQIGTYTWENTADGDLDVLGSVFDPSSAITPNASDNYGLTFPADNADDILSNFTLASVGLDLNPAIADIESGDDFISFFFVPGDDSVAAQYKGGPFSDLYPARMYIEAGVIPEPETAALLTVLVALVAVMVRKRATLNRAA